MSVKWSPKSRRWGRASKLFRKWAECDEYTAPFNRRDSRCMPLDKTTPKIDGWLNRLQGLSSSRWVRLQSIGRIVSRMLAVVQSRRRRKAFVDFLSGSSDTRRSGIGIRASSRRCSRCPRIWCWWTRISSAGRSTRYLPYCKWITWQHQKEELRQPDCQDLQVGQCRRNSGYHIKEKISWSRTLEWFQSP